MAREEYYSCHLVFSFEQTNGTTDGANGLCGTLTSSIYMHNAN